MPRLFTALEIPAEIGASLASLRGGLPGARWIDPDNYHLTLRFIGDIDDALARDITLILGEVRRNAFSVQFAGLQSFGGRRPRAVVATAAPSPPLFELQAEHERLMQRIGLAPEGRKYTPHVTLARLRDSSSRQVADYLAVREPYRSIDVSGVALRPLFVARLGGRRPLCGGSVLSARRPGGVNARPASFSAACASVRPAPHWRAGCRRRPISRNMDSGVGNGVSTSPTTLPKSKVSSASNLRANCCMRWLSARQVMCRRRMRRLRAVNRQRSSRAEPTPWLCHGFSMLKAVSAASVSGAVEETKLGRSPQHAVDKEAMQDDAETADAAAWSADDIVVDGAAEAVAAAVGVESEQVIAILVGFADPQFADHAAFTRGSSIVEAFPAVRRLWRSLLASSTTDVVAYPRQSTFILRAAKLWQAQRTGTRSHLLNYCIYMDITLSWHDPADAFVAAARRIG